MEDQSLNVSETTTWISPLLDCSVLDLELKVTTFKRGESDSREQEAIVSKHMREAGWLVLHSHKTAEGTIVIWVHE